MNKLEIINERLELIFLLDKCQGTFKGIDKVKNYGLNSWTHPYKQYLGLKTYLGNPGQTDQPKPEQIDHLIGWQKSCFFAGKNLKFMSS